MLNNLIIKYHVLVTLILTSQHILSNINFTEVYVESSMSLDSICPQACSFTMYFFVCFGE